MPEYQLILASSSPRRRDFLEKMGLSFTIVKPDIDESRLDGENPDIYVQRMAREKAEVIAQAYPQSVVLAADTIVVCRDEILGKPRNREDAKRILRTLSGKTHEVLTAVAIRLRDSLSNGHAELIPGQDLLVKTRVTFAPLTEELIDTYVASGECDDKSGAYAVQGVGAMFIEKVEGSVSSVVGLPVCQVRDMLSKFGFYPQTVNANQWK